MINKELEWIVEQIAPSRNLKWSTEWLEMLDNFTQAIDRGCKFCLVAGVIFQHYPLFECFLALLIVGLCIAVPTGLYVEFSKKTKLIPRD